MSIKENKNGIENKLIFLTGMPAAGKTWWGSKLGHEYNLPFTDLDSFIEQHEQASITSLFGRHGEDGFRQKEHEYLKKVIAIRNTPAMIACGGGTPCFKDNLQVMKKNGKVIYLRAGIPHLLGNINKSSDISGTGRPLLSGQEDMAGYLADMLTTRKKIYEQADFILDAENISMVTFGQIIPLCLNRH